MSYRLAIEAAALKALADLPRQVADRVEAHIEALAHDPRPPGARQLAGEFRGMYRLRVGDYRIVYDVDDGAQTVRVAIVGHRGRAYRRSGR